jgi:hypothetical protein
MLLFISWSGQRSRKIGEAFYWFLPMLMNEVKPWLSTHMEKGVRPMPEIADALESANFGLVCLTPTNLGSEWIHFEAGALSKKANVAHVCTYLTDLEPSGFSGPLTQFQHTRANKDETKALIQTINSKLPRNSVEPERLDEAFETFYPKFEKMLAGVGSEDPPPPRRPQEDMLDEILTRLRNLERAISPPTQPLQKSDIEELLTSIKTTTDAMGVTFQLTTIGHDTIGVILQEANRDEPIKIEIPRNAGADTIKDQLIQAANSLANAPEQASEKT